MNCVTIGTSFQFPDQHGCKVNRKAIDTLTMMFVWKTSPSALCWAIILDVHVEHHDAFISIFDTSYFLSSDMLLSCLPSLFHPLQYDMFFLLFCLFYVISFLVIAFPVCPTGSILKPQKWAQKKSLLVSSEDSDIPFVSFHHRNSSPIWWTNLDFLTQLSQRSTPHRIFVKEDS